MAQQSRSVYIMNTQYFIQPSCVCVGVGVCWCVCFKAKSSFPPLMITGTIDCDVDERARSARGVTEGSGHV